MAEAGEIVGPVRIHQRVDLGQFIAASGDDRSRPPTCRACRASASGSRLVVPQSTVTSSVAPLAASTAHRLDIGAVAFEDAVGDVDQRIEPAMAQVPGQQRRRGGAVDVVIAEDRDLLAARRRVRDALAPPSPSASRCGDRASVCGWSDRGSPRPRRSRRRGPPAPAPASPAIGSAARSPAPAPRPGHRAGRARICRSPNAARRETPAAIQRAERMREAS